MVLSAFLAEDSEEIRNALVESMEVIAPVQFTGVAISEAGAREWLTANQYGWDLAIIDITLQQGSGLGVIDSCRTRSAMQKVVVLTGDTDQRIWQRCRELGADAVFNKSCDLEKLVNFCEVHATYLQFMLDSGLVRPGATGWNGQHQTRH